MPYERINWDKLKNQTWKDMIENKTPEEFEKVIKKLGKEIETTKEKVENNYINIIQIISILVAILALILGNILGFIALPKDLGAQKIIGYLFMINGIILLGITFLMILINLMFFEKKLKLDIKSIVFFSIPIIIQIIGYNMTF